MLVLLKLPAKQHPLTGVDDFCDDCWTDRLNSISAGDNSGIVQQVPTPEIAESPIGIFRTGSAPVSPGSNDISVQPPLPRVDDHPLIPSPSSHYPIPAREWSHGDTNEQVC